MSLTIFTGNIGTGKSLLANKFAKNNYVIVNMDTIQSMVGGGEYGLYDNEKKEVYQAIETTAIETALKLDLSVVVDRTNMDRKRRLRFIEIGKKYTEEIISIDWGAGDEKTIARRINSPHGVSEETWRHVHKFMSDSYEKPSLEEGFSKLINPPTKFKFYAFDFDGTIVTNKFPEIVKIINTTVDKINTLWEDLSNIIIIWSCRSGDYENKMRSFLLKNKIKFDFINENPVFETGSRKIYADRYYDGDCSHS